MRADDDVPGGDMEHELPFGPYRGEGVETVAVMDPGYLLDLVREGVGPAGLRAAAGQALARRGRLPEAAGDTPDGGSRGRQPNAGAPGRRPWMVVLALGTLGALLVALADLGPGSGEGRPVVSIEPPATVGSAATDAPRATATRTGFGSEWSTAGVPGSSGTQPPCGARAEGAIPAESAGDFADTFQAVEFRVVRTKDTGRVTFLNSHDPYQGHFYVAVFPGDYDEFPEPPANHFRNECIVVQGTIELYRGTPQIVLRSADDVRILED